MYAIFAVYSMYSMYSMLIFCMHGIKYNFAFNAKKNIFLISVFVLFSNKNI